MSFLRLILDLLPEGPYSKSEDALHVKELAAFAAELEAADTAVAGLLDELFPGTAVETLPDWERVFKVVPPTTATTEERQAVLLAEWGKQPTLALTYIDTALETFTGVTVTIVEELPPLYDSATYDVATFFAWTFQAVLDYAEAAAAGVGLADLLAAQGFLDDIQPGHTQGTVLVGGARYDDSTTPYDYSTFGV